MKRSFQYAAIALACTALMAITLPLQAQNYEQSPAQAPQQVPQQAPIYSQQQIDQMVAPIALYPDQLVSQVLMASTYPLEVVLANRWLQTGDNKDMQGDELAAAMQQQPWDPSIKSLVPFPEILSMMDNNLTWTEQLGDAFLSQQAGVMDSVQRLRHMAQASGNLASTPQQTVAVQQGEVIIAPAQPQVVYVPVYNPMVVYGTWPYPAYQPYYFPPPPYYSYASAGIISFGIGIPVVTVLWGWDRWDWHHHAIHIDDRRFTEINRGRPPHFAGTWEHNPYHRHGVPYQTADVREHFQQVAAINHVSNRDNNRFGGRPEGDRRGLNENFRAPQPSSLQTNAIQPWSPLHSQATVERGPQTNVPSVQRSVFEQRLKQEQDQNAQHRQGNDNRLQSSAPNEAQQAIQRDRAQQNAIRDRIQEQAAQQEEMRRQQQNQPSAISKMRAGGVHLERQSAPQQVSLPAQSLQEQQPARQEQRQPRREQRQIQVQPVAQQQPQQQQRNGEANVKNQDNRGHRNDEGNHARAPEHRDGGHGDDEQNRGH